jgi:hypothetical protein
VFGRSTPPASPVPYDRIDFGHATVQVVKPVPLVEVRLNATDLNGNPLPNNRLQAGQQFLVNAYVQDIRTDIVDSLKGVFSAYLDVVYPVNLAAPCSLGYQSLRLHHQFCRSVHSRSKGPVPDRQRLDRRGWSVSRTSTGSTQRSTAPTVCSPPDLQHSTPPGGTGTLGLHSRSGRSAATESRCR